MFESLPKLLLGLITGIIFGFLLQKGRVAKFPVIIGQFLLKDWTVVKIMSVAVAVGTVGVYTMYQLSLVHLDVKPLQFGAMLMGGVLFGIGITILGYCPGTSVAASGEGHRDAMVGVLGMIAGAFAYVLLFTPLQTAGKGLGDMGKITFPHLTGTSPWIWIIGVIVATSALVWFLEKKRL